MPFHFIWIKLTKIEINGFIHSWSSCQNSSQTEGFMWEWNVYQVIVKTDGKHSGVLEKLQLSDAGTEITCIYFLYGAKAHKCSERK